MNQHFKNRTDDFRRKMTSGGVEEMTQLIPSKTKKTSSVFLQTAQQVSKQIHSTGMKLKKLSSLAKKKSLFDDPTVEINELTFVIKKEIKVLQSTLEDLDKTYGKRKSTQVFISFFVFVLPNYFDIDSFFKVSITQCGDCGMFGNRYRKDCQSFFKDFRRKEPEYSRTTKIKVFSRLLFIVPLIDSLFHHSSFSLDKLSLEIHRQFPIR